MLLNSQCKKENNVLHRTPIEDLSNSDLWRETVVTKQLQYESDSIF